MLFASEIFHWIRDGHKAPAERAGKCSHCADESRAVDEAGMFCTVQDYDFTFQSLAPNAHHEARSPPVLVSRVSVSL
jgi:hypothetical protein